MNLTFTARTAPACQDFLKIRKDDVCYTIDEFIAKYHSDSDEVLGDCVIQYREAEMSHQKMVDDYVAFSEGLEFYNFQEPAIVFDNSIQAAIYFAKKARECLQIARFFAMKSSLLLDTDYNLNWSQGYVPQYLFRCINFGTASTWYSNCFDNILQVAYWGFSLYTSAVDRDGNSYDDSWDAKKIMGICTYELVVAELKTRGLKDIRKSLTSCSGKFEDVRMWANYIKHKGGIGYKHLEAEKPFQVYLMPIEEGQEKIPPLQIGDKYKQPDERFAINDFKSPVEVDIDANLPRLRETHIAIHKCLGEIVTAVDFDGHSVKIGSKEGNPNE